MSGKREQKRADLRERLIDAAEDQIRETGLDGLRARDIAAQAGCALGGVYNAFEDMDDLVLYVNLRTVSNLDAALTQARNTGEGPREQLLALAASYHIFALQNHNLWIALFDYDMHKKPDLPELYLEKHIQMFRHIELTLQALQPEQPAQKVVIAARILFSAVHGIVSISLQDRFTAVPKEMLEEHLRAFLLTFIRGIEARGKDREA